jgi:hypothetical protein
MKVLIHISSQKKIFLQNLVVFFLERGDVVDLLIRDEFIFSELNNENVNQVFIEQANLKNFDPYNFSKVKILRKALLFEKKYKTNLSFLMSKDRGLGRGYLTNVDNYVDVEKASWNGEQKLNYFFHLFENLEKIILKSKPNLIISVARNDYISILCKEKKIKYFNLAESRIGSRYIWSNNDFNTSNFLLKEIKKNIKKKTLKNIGIKNKQPTESLILQSAAKYGLIGTFQSILSMFIRELKIITLQSRKKFSYVKFGWIKVIFQRYFAYKFFLKNSVNIGDEKIEKKNIVYVPLHLEPEVALMGFSPEFSNSIEMITWLSKSLPVNYLIVVKEQPNAYGTRSLKYYKSLIQMPNVVLAHPKIHPWKWIKKSFCVATITGTSAVEAVFMLKPVISYGKHQIVNLLATVKYCNNFFTTQKSLCKLINRPFKRDILLKSRNILFRSIYDNSFELKEFAQNKFTLINNIKDKTLKNINSENIAFHNLLKFIKAN